MKLVEVAVRNLGGLPDRTYSFAESDGNPRAVVVLVGDTASALLEVIAALVEAARADARALHRRAWWGSRRGPEEARLRVRWALSEGEAARAPGWAGASEWRFGPPDDVPRELRSAGEPSPGVRADLAGYAFLDANRSAVWMGGPAADPLVEALTGIVRRDVAATRAYCRLGQGLVGTKTPDTFSELNRAIARILPGLRLERVACGRDERPVACFRGEQRVEVDQLDDHERDAIHIVATLHAAKVRDGVILVDRPEQHVQREARARWLDWLAGLAHNNQLFVAAAEPIGSFVQKV